jgi:hypothetical protein
MPMNRAQVYTLIDGEREYQNRLPADRTDDSAKSVGDYITMLSHYQAELIKAWTTKAGNEAALDVMRKIAGITVHCMEDHGAPARK